jgi:GNAT superfamily N-acetyltransferase
MPKPNIQIIDTDAKTIGDYGFCGFRNATQEGYKRKIDWLTRRFAEGMKFKVLHVPGEGAVGFIEYTPGEYTWRPIEAPGYLVVHCIMIHRKAYKGKGYGALLVEECLKDAKRRKTHGVAVVTSGGTWMASPGLFLRSGFASVDTAPPSFELLVKRLHEAPVPKFKKGWDRTLRRYESGLTIIQSDQCPCVANSTKDILAACKDLHVRPTVVELKNGRQARAAPSAYGIFNIVYDGKLVADHPISATRFRTIMRRVM